MRFITEFESTYGGESQQRYIDKIPYWQERGEVDMGTMIGKSFGWSQRKVSSEMRHTLEIEAFPMDKWIEFKEKCFKTLNITEYDRYTLSELIKELESFGELQL